MEQESMSKGLKQIWQMNDADLAKAVPRYLNQVYECGYRKAVEEDPAVLSMMVHRLLDTDVAQFMTDVGQDCCDKFMDFIGEAVNVHVEESPQPRSSLQAEELDLTLRSLGRALRVNIEASDSPLKGYFAISRGNITGGSHLFHLNDQDFRIHGPTDAILLLLVGNLPLGFSNPRLMTDGHPAFGPYVATVLGELAQTAFSPA